MMEDILRLKKKSDRDGGFIEIGIINSVSPHLSFTINGQSYSSSDFTIYVPAVDRIQQWEEIVATTPDHIVGTTSIDIGDLELVPDIYERKFLKDDLIAVADRGDSFVILGRLVKWDDTKELYQPTHRDR